MAATNAQLVKALNEALAQEHACYIRYKTHATVLRGPYAETVGHRLDEIGEDEEKHAQLLRVQIDNLGGEPTMDVSRAELKPATKLADILAVNIAEEKKAIAMYQKLLHLPGMKEGAWLFETVEDILEDEQEHLYELETLRG